MKGKSEEGTATIWLTTAEMGFSLTEEQDAIVCTNDVKEGKVNDRYLAPAVSRFAADMRKKVGTGADADRQTTDVGKQERKVCVAKMRDQGECTEWVEKAF